MPDTTPQRKYVDLIFCASNKYANWDPELVVQVGDYGRITEGRASWLPWWRKNGIFMKEGNIYDSGIAKELEIPEPTEHDVSDDGLMWITSRNAKETNASGEVGTQAPAFPKCSMNASFEFSSGAGAVLVMKNDCITTIDPPGCLKRLLERDTMRSYVVVSEVHRCSSYMRCLTSPDTKNLAIGMKVEPPIFGLGRGEVKWMRSTRAGNFKANAARGGDRKFYPLYRLSALKEGGLATGVRGGDELPDALPPWMTIELKEETAEDTTSERTGSQESG